jgi:hypothetical protein
VEATEQGFDTSSAHGKLMMDMLGGHHGRSDGLGVAKFLSDNRDLGRAR